MEITRVLIDTGDPCAGCGTEAAVFMRSVEGVDGVEWVEEARECGHGCDELAAAIPASAPARSARRSRVA